MLLTLSDRFFHSIFRLRIDHGEYYCTVECRPPLLTKRKCRPKAFFFFYSFLFQSISRFQLMFQALYFHNGNNFKLSGLTHLNNQNNHITVHDCSGVSLSNLHINAPADSPNGIDLSFSTQVLISDSFLGTGISPSCFFFSLKKNI